MIRNTKLQIAAVAVLMAWQDYDDNPDKFVLALSALHSALPKRLSDAVNRIVAERDNLKE